MNVLTSAFFAVTLGVFSGCAHATPKPVTDETRAPRPVVLPPTLEAQRPSLERDVLEAQQRLEAFAHRFGWDAHVRERFATRTEIFDDKARFDERLIALTGAPKDMKLPPTYMGALEEGILIVCSPAIYARNFPAGVEPGSFPKLMTHEMAHRLHVRILDGKEEEMGPVWFFEGFAIFAADQFAGDKREVTPDELWKIVDNPERGSYAAYARVMRFLVKRAPLPHLVAHARRPDFSAWLRQLVETTPG